MSLTLLLLTVTGQLSDGQLLQVHSQVRERLAEIDSSVFSKMTNLVEHRMLQIADRKLQSASSMKASLDDIKNKLWEEKAYGPAGALEDFQGMFCNGSVPSIDDMETVSDWMWGEIGEAVGRDFSSSTAEVEVGLLSEDVAPLVWVQKLMPCLCSAHWNLRVPAVTDLWESMFDILTRSPRYGYKAGDTGTALRLLFTPKIKAALPMVLSRTTGSCNEACRISITELVTTMLGVVDKVELPGHNPGRRTSSFIQPFSDLGYGLVDFVRRVARGYELPDWSTAIPLEESPVRTQLGGRLFECVCSASYDWGKIVDAVFEIPW